MFSLHGKSNKNIFKQIKSKNPQLYPRISSPIIYKEISTNSDINKGLLNFGKITKQPKFFGLKETQMNYKSNSGNRKYKINNINSFNNSTDNNINYENLKNIPSYSELCEIWNDFDVLESYRNLFYMVLNKLNEEEKEELCNKEIKELNDLKNHINSLLKEIQTRKKILNQLNQLNKSLEEIILSEEKIIDEDILRKVSDNITNLRIHSVNIVHRMKKIKAEIAQGCLFGKYDINLIALKFGFDKNYIVKMKEEMKFLKEGYIRHYFNISNDMTPFLLKASEQNSNTNGEPNEPNMRVVPISNELKDNIKQCNYYIYQELIYLQNNKTHNIISGKRFGSFDYKDTNKYSSKKNEINLKATNFKDINQNDNYNKSNIIQKEQDFINDNNNNNKNDGEESILFGEKGINIKDILGETTSQNKYNFNNQIINKHHNLKLNAQSSSTKKLEKSMESQISRKSLMSFNSNNFLQDELNRVSCKYSDKYFKVIIFSEVLNNFIDKNYNDYYNQIPEQEIKMFNLQKDIKSSLINGITPFLLLVKEEGALYGLCALYYIYNKNQLSLKISHLSALADENESDFYDNIRIVFATIFHFIKSKFYFDELFLEFSKNEKNEEIYNIFINNLFFTEKTIVAQKNQNEINGGDELSVNNEDSNNNNINYLLYKKKMNTNESIKDCVSVFLGNNLFYFFNTILLTNKYKCSTESSGELGNLKYSNSDLFINVLAINNLFQSKSNINTPNIFRRINSLEQLIKLFIQNNINSEEIPLSMAENRYDIICFVLKKIINDVSKNSLTLLNNYNIYNSKSYYDETSGIFYNFMKPEKIYLIKDEKNSLNFYIITNNNSLAICFIQINKKLFFRKNMYTQINEIYKELLLPKNNTKIEILDNKFIWIPCFNVYRHLKCLINNSFFTVHEYISFSNKIIDKNFIQKREVNKAYGLLFNSKLHSFSIQPNLNNDIILDNDFIVEIINNASYFNNIKIKEDNNNNINKEKVIGSPSIILLNYVYEVDFIKN